MNMNETFGTGCSDDASSSRERESCTSGAGSSRRSSVSVSLSCGRGVSACTLMSSV